VDFETFKTINERFPMVLFPSFRLQDNLQAFTLGTVMASIIEPEVPS
jgi:hypothetical protein